MCVCTHKALHSNSLNRNGHLIFPVYPEIRKGEMGMASSLTSLRFKFLIFKSAISAAVTKLNQPINLNYLSDPVPW